MAVMSEAVATQAATSEAAERFRLLLTDFVRNRDGLQSYDLSCPLLFVAHVYAKQACPWRMPARVAFPLGVTSGRHFSVTLIHL